MLNFCNRVQGKGDDKTLWIHKSELNRVKTLKKDVFYIINKDRILDRTVNLLGKYRQWETKKWQNICKF